MEHAALQSYVGRMFGRSSEIRWEDIYRDGKACAILGEPGSGKSEELRQQVCELCAAGTCAVYVDLRSLLGGTTLRLDDGDTLISEWHRGEAVAWFFLDSVDESKLQHVSDFHRALKQMAAWVGADATRARYVISSRISEWRPATDRRLVVAELLRREAGGGETESPLRVLSLLPLTNEQARKFQAGGSNDCIDDAFFAAVEQADAWEFMRRPLDVTDLYALWQRRGRLGTLSEVVENAIDRLLEDPRERSSMPVARLREGAEHLAACLALNKSVSLVIQDAVALSDRRRCLREDSHPSPHVSGLSRVRLDSTLDAGRLPSI